jgi:hypothetical protein
MRKRVEAVLQNKHVVSLESCKDRTTSCNERYLIPLMKLLFLENNSKL